MASNSIVSATVAEIAAQERNAIVGGPFGSDLVSKDYVARGIPVIRGQNMSGGRWVTGEFVYVSEKKAESLKANTARPFDIVFTQRGTLGQVSIVPPEGAERYVISQSQMKLTPDISKADPLYLYYYFTSDLFRHYIQTNTIQTGVPHINLGILKNAEVILPALKEQRRIARILGALDDKNELNRRMNQTLEAIVRVLFKSWFVDFDPVRAKVEGRDTGLPKHITDLFPNRFVDSELGEIPEGWGISEIGDEVETVGGATPSTKNSVYWDGDIAWATPKDMSGLTAPVLLHTSRTISARGLEKISSGLLPKGTVLMSSRAPVGYLAVAAEPVAINQGFIAMKCNRRLPNYYVLNWAMESMGLIKSNASGSTFAEISKKAFRPLPVLVPSGRVLAAFTDVVAPVYENIEMRMREAKSLTQLRDLLLPKLLSGKLSAMEAA